MSGGRIRKARFTPSFMAAISGQPNCFATSSVAAMLTTIRVRGDESPFSAMILAIAWSKGSPLPGCNP